jgi:putative hydrolase of the HAD superfamily
MTRSSAVPDRVKAAVFDLDDTLIVEEASARASLRRASELVAGVAAETFAELVLSVARRLWLSGPFYPLVQRLGISSWEGLWSTFEGNDRVVDGLRAWAPEYRSEAWRATLAELGIDDPLLADQLSDAYRQAQVHAHPLMAGAEALVRSLAGRYPLGLLTNGPSDIQRLKLARTGLADCFDAVVVSGELGIGKPDPAVFREVLERLGAEPDSAVMVGDSWERDIVGAVGVGMSAVWVSRGRDVPEALPGVTAVKDVGSIVGLTG